MKSSADACLPESVVVPKYVFQQETTFYQPDAICYDESCKDKISVVYHCCPTSWLLAALTRSCLIDRFLEGQGAYYSPCQIPSRRCESVRYSIVKWWLNLAVVFWTRLPPAVMRSQHLRTNKCEEISSREYQEALRKHKMWRYPSITLNWTLVHCNSALVLHNYTFQQTSSSPSISLIDQCDCDDGWTDRAELHVCDSLQRTLLLLWWCTAGKRSELTQKSCKELPPSGLGTAAWCQITK